MGASQGPVEMELIQRLESGWGCGKKSLASFFQGVEKVPVGNIGLDCPR
jgi:hypothetical protein